METKVIYFCIDGATIERDLLCSFYPFANNFRWADPELGDIIPDEAWKMMPELESNKRLKVTFKVYEKNMFSKKDIHVFQSAEITEREIHPEVYVGRGVKVKGIGVYGEISRVYGRVSNPKAFEVRYENSTLNGWLSHKMYNTKEFDKFFEGH